MVRNLFDFIRGGQDLGSLPFIFEKGLGVIAGLLNGLVEAYLLVYDADIKPFHQLRQSRLSVLLLLEQIDRFFWLQLLSLIVLIYVLFKHEAVDVSELVVELMWLEFDFWRQVLKAIIH
jgi:hypothetical protein